MKYVGVKQVLKAIESSEVSTVYIGEDAEELITDKLVKLCDEKNIEVKRIKTMEELGKLAGIEVPSAAAAE